MPLKKWKSRNLKSTLCRIQTCYNSLRYHFCKLQNSGNEFKISDMDDMIGSGDYVRILRFLKMVSFAIVHVQILHKVDFKLRRFLFFQAFSRHFLLNALKKEETLQLKIYFVQDLDILPQRKIPFLQTSEFGQQCIKKEIKALESQLQELWVVKNKVTTYVCSSYVLTFVTDCIKG